MKKLFTSAVVTGLVTFAATASAQSFPQSDKYTPLPCGGGYMVDALRDQSGALRERDIVGDNLAFAGYHASDAQFLYLRLRLDDDPAPGGALRPYAWGFELSTDSNRSNYEVLIILDGTTKNIAVHKNTTTTLADDPNDPADEPPVATFPFTTHGRTSIAGSSKYGGDNDYFLDIAVPWTTLQSLGVARTTPLTVWAATSSSATGLNGDFACHDGTGGAPKLSTIAANAPTQTTLDPNVDTERDGWSDAVEVSSGTDPNNAASKPSGAPPPIGGVEDPVLAGAGGCAYGASGPSGLFVMLGILGLLAKRRRS